MRATLVPRPLVLTLALGMSLAALSVGSAGASGKNWVGVAQTVVVSTQSTGEVTGTPEVFTQISANGSSPVTVKVPMPNSGFRNLDALGTPPINDGQAVWDLNLDGPTSERTVAHFPPGQLPLQVSVKYRLNGKPSQAKDILGKSGQLEVTYHIRNTTSKATTVSFKNILGTRETRTVSAPVPFAALFDVTFPTSFTNLRAPGATVSVTATGNGTVSAEWVLFLFDPLGGVDQSVTYQANVTNAVVPSSTLAAAPIPPASLNTLPTIGEPNAPSVPTVTVGSRLASLQAGSEAKLQQIATKATAVLSALQQVVAPAARSVSARAGRLAARLEALSAAAQSVSTAAGGVATRLARAAAAAARIAQRAVDVLAKLKHLPVAVKLTPAYKTLRASVVGLVGLATADAAHVDVTAAKAKVLHSLALKAAVIFAGAANGALALSTKAAQVASMLTDATAPRPQERRTIQPEQVGGGARIDAAVGQLDAAISKAGNTVDDDYAYLTALDTRAGENQLPSGSASGATAQAGYLVYSIEGANDDARHIATSLLIGILALLIGGYVGGRRAHRLSRQTDLGRA